MARISHSDLGEEYRLVAPLGSAMQNRLSHRLGRHVIGIMSDLRGKMRQSAIPPRCFGFRIHPWEYRRAPGVN